MRDFETTPYGLAGSKRSKKREILKQFGGFETIEEQCLCAIWAGSCPAESRLIFHECPLVFIKNCAIVLKRSIFEKKTGVLLYWMSRGGSGLNKFLLEGVMLDGFGSFLVG